MTDLEAERIRALSRCTMLPGSYEKRFVRDLSVRDPVTTSLTEKQAALVESLAWRFRRQMPARLVPEEKPA